MSKKLIPKKTNYQKELAEDIKSGYNTIIIDGKVVQFDDSWKQKDEVDSQTYWNQATILPEVTVVSNAPKRVQYTYWNWDSVLPEVTVVGTVPNHYEDQNTDHPVERKEIPEVIEFQPYIKELPQDDSWRKWDKDHDGELSSKERQERQKAESTLRDWRKLVSGINNTADLAASLASLFYGGGWAATRLLNRNRSSALGQYFAKYVLPSNAVDTGFDALQFIVNPNFANGSEVASGIALGRWKDFSKTPRQIAELASQGLNVNNIVQ